LKRYLDEKESENAGYAVGILIGLSERLLSGNIDFTHEEIEKLVKASEIFNEYSLEEQIELIQLGIKDLVKESAE